MANQGYTREKPQDIHANNLHLLKKKIKEGNIGGVYIFYGDEEYTKNHYCSLLLKSAETSLNVTSFYGSEFTLPAFLSACETNAVESLDMFSLDNEENDTDDGAFRIIKLYSPDFSELTKKDTDYFLEFLEELPEKTAVIFWFYTGETDWSDTGIYQKLSELSLVVNFRREPVGSATLVTWILRHFAKEKINVDRYIAVHLCQTVGNSMTDLKNEIEKLIDYLRFENRDTLEKQDIDFICIKSTDAQVFDISGGALSGDFRKAARALGVLRDKKENPLLIFGTISKAIYDLCTTDCYIKKGLSIPAIAKATGTREFVIKNSASILNSRGKDFTGKESFPEVCTRLCIEYDKKLKSSRTDGYELLMELIFKLSFAGKSTP